MVNRRGYQCNISNPSYLYVYIWARAWGEDFVNCCSAPSAHVAPAPLSLARQPHPRSSGLGFRVSHHPYKFET